VKKNKPTKKPVAITMGDPAGVGPEIIVKALQKLIPDRKTTQNPQLIVADPGIMEKAVNRFAGTGFKKMFRDAPVFEKPEQVENPAPPLALYSVGRLDPERMRPGRPGGKEGRAAALCLEAALELVQKKICRALVTAPVAKAALAAAGFNHPGHTGWLAQKTDSRVLMMIAAGKFRVVPLTGHVPLERVPGLISASLLASALELLDQELKKWFRIKRPRIAVAGLNPHAGEQGTLGEEEIEIIAPAIAAGRKKGIEISGPFPADTLFTPERRRTYDAALCMFHDQALIPIKTLGMNRAVNLTLGLPFVRTSPAHGTAPDIAWQGTADPESMIRAIKLAGQRS